MRLSLTSCESPPSSTQRDTEANKTAGCRASPADSLMGRQTPTQGDRKMNCARGRPAPPLGLGTRSSLLNPQPSSPGSRGLCVVELVASLLGPRPCSTAHSPHGLLLCPSRLRAQPSVPLPCLWAQPGTCACSASATSIALAVPQTGKLLSCQNRAPVLPSAWSASPAPHGSFLPHLSLVQLSPQLNIPGRNPPPLPAHPLTCLLGACSLGQYT